MIITIDGANANELKSKIAELAKAFGVETGMPAQLSLMTESPAVEDSPKKRGKKKAESIVSTEETEALTEKAPTSASPLDALQKLNAAKGLDAARAVLAEFGCAKLSDIKEAQNADFILACEKASK